MFLNNNSPKQRFYPRKNLVICKPIVEKNSLVIYYNSIVKREVLKFDIQLYIYIIKMRQLRDIEEYLLAIIKDILLINNNFLVNFWVKIIDTSNYI